MNWLKDKGLAGDIVTGRVICVKASIIYDDLIKLTARTSMVDAPGELFKASRGLFNNFKKRTGIQSVVRHGEAASWDVKAAKASVKTPRINRERRIHRPTSFQLPCNLVILEEEVTENVYK